jgi:hypothetical protein
MRSMAPMVGEEGVASVKVVYYKAPVGLLNTLPG